MPLEKALRQGEYLIYLTVIFITAVLLGFSMYLVFYRLYNHIDYLQRRVIARERRQR